MEFIVRVEARLAGRVVKVCDVVTIARPGVVRGEEELGLSLEDGKEIVRELQSRVIAVQVEMLEAANSLCIHCGHRKDIKDRRPRQFRTVFGVVRVRCRRFIFCTCRGGKARNEWPLRHLWRSNTTPEFRYLLAKFGSDMPYRRAAQLLTELLPLPNGSVSHTTVRRHTLLVGERFDQRALEPDEYDWPECQREPAVPAHRVTVAIDGTYIRAGLDCWNRQLHVVAGRIDKDGQLGSHFAWVARESVASTHMKAVLEDQGCNSNSMVAVLADGADGLGGIVRRVIPQTPRTILDWFHISMRLRHIEQMGPSMMELFPQVEALGKIPRLRYKMWNGQWRGALHRMRDCYHGTGLVATTITPIHAERVKRFRRHLIDLRDYLISNQRNLTNYGKARRDGLRISSAPAESGMNHLINQRMGKRQPMRWSADGAHLLLQVRCAVLDRRLVAFSGMVSSLPGNSPITSALAA
jgi:hypothetical protein